MVDSLMNDRRLMPSMMTENGLRETEFLYPVSHLAHFALPQRPIAATPVFVRISVLITKMKFASLWGAAVNGSRLSNIPPWV
jgi:hypothetical protein